MRAELVSNEAHTFSRGFWTQIPGRWPAQIRAMARVSCSGVCGGKGRPHTAIEALARVDGVGALGLALASMIDGLRRSSERWPQATLSMPIMIADQPAQ